MSEPLKVYIGFDSREATAYEVAERTLRRHASVPVSVTPLNLRHLEEQGLLSRPTDLRGQRYDLLSNAPASTEFAISRFLVPMLAQTGWALFVDSDVVFLDDVAKLFSLAAAEPQCAVMCVQHPTGEQGVVRKMDNQFQTQYVRKNWSSVMLFNCDHPANRRLSIHDIQWRRGFDLHQFYWLADSEIGALPPQWNWLVNAQPAPDEPKVAHFTLGGPFLHGWEPHPHDDIWLRARDAA